MVKQRGDVWYAVVYVPDATGVKKQKWIRLPQCKSERAARSEEARLKVELGKKPALVSNKQTVGEYLLQWLQIVKSQLRPKTYEGYKEKIHNYLIPELGSIPLTKLTPDVIEAAYARLRERPLHRSNTSQTLAPQTIKNSHRVLSAALNRAVKQRRLEWNPASAVSPPKVNRRDIEPWTTDEILTLLAAAKEEDSLYYMPIYLGMATGLRRGEILGLRWSDLNLDKRTLTVVRTVEQTIEEGITIGVPKTLGSRRTILLPSVLVEALREHKMNQRQKMARKGVIQTDFLPICCHDNGKLLSPSGLSHGFTYLQRKLGMRPMRFHDLRHYHASFLIALGAPIKAISARLGHASSKITMDTYGHLLTGVEDNMVDNLDQSFRHAMGEPEEDGRDQVGTG